MIWLLDATAILIGLLALCYAAKRLLPTAWWPRWGARAAATLTGCSDCRHCPTGKR